MEAFLNHLNMTENFEFQGFPKMGRLSRELKNTKV